MLAFINRGSEAIFVPGLVGVYACDRIRLAIIAVLPKRGLMIVFCKEQWKSWVDMFTRTLLLVVNGARLVLLFVSGATKETEEVRVERQGCLCLTAAGPCPHSKCITPDWAGGNRAAPRLGVMSYA